MKQYHYTVYVEVDDDGTLHPPQVDPEIKHCGVGQGITVYDPTDDNGWEHPDEDTDIRAITYLSAVLEAGRTVVPPRPKPTTLNRTGIGIGDYVGTDTHGYRGRVYAVHFGCPEDKRWIAGQRVPIRDEALAPGYIWFSILTHGGGAIVAPAYGVHVIDPFDFVNDFEAEYWPAR